MIIQRDVINCIDRRTMISDKNEERIVKPFLFMKPATLIFSETSRHILPFDL